MLRLLLPFYLLTTTTVLAFAIEKSRIPGIWRLTVSEASNNNNAVAWRTTTGETFRSNLLSREEDPFVAATTTTTSDGAESKSKKPQQGNETTILLKLNPDGSFRQCSEDYQEGCWISGRWKKSSTSNTDDDASGDEVLLLALDRQYYGPRHDVLLQGKSIAAAAAVENCTTTAARSILLFQGEVYTGKFMYPKHHPAFFQSGEPLVQKNWTGCTFSMEQAVATTSVWQPHLSNKEQQNVGAATTNNSTTQLQPMDFYGRRFYMTVAPLPTLTRTRDDPSTNKLQQQLPVDIRAMPVQFHANNTFTALGTNKILRGRFEVRNSNVDSNSIDGDDKQQQQQLWFQVSLFGAGRSAPGSVYSEGLGLTHDDKRTYTGEILVAVNDDEATRRRIFVSGTVTFGSDLGTDARPEPVGIFELLERKNDYDDDDGDDLRSMTTRMVDKDASAPDEQDNNDAENSVFE